MLERKMAKIWSLKLMLCGQLQMAWLTFTVLGLWLLKKHHIQQTKCFILVRHLFRRSRYIQSWTSRIGRFALYLWSKTTLITGSVGGTGAQCFRMVNLRHWGINFDLSIFFKFCNQNHQFLWIFDRFSNKNGQNNDFKLKIAKSH